MSEPGKRRWQGGMVIVFAAMMLMNWPASAPAQAENARARLGARLFRDERFSSPNGDLRASCSQCHLVDEDPTGVRAFADFFTRSWIPWREQDPRREALRNAPTILDAADMPRLHFDGEFTSLEQLVTTTLASRMLGWLPGEQEAAYAQAHRVLLEDAGDRSGNEPAYREQFRRAYGVRLETLGRDQAIDYAARAVSDFMRTLKSLRNSPYDRFVALNGLAAQPAAGESAAAFGERLLERVAALEKERALRLVEGFDAEALAGMKVFYRARGAASVGNCAACHAPPSFTDHSFHNLGISQVEYDRLHGEGSFAALEIPAAAARPVARFLEAPQARKPGYADLGHWNFAKPDDKGSLRRFIAAFKTPTLRNLAYSQPYMHNGLYASLGEAVEELRRLGRMAREGRVREADEELARIDLSSADVGPLVAFLNSLNEDLRSYRRIRSGE